jgi:acetolactate synthase-like protein
MEILLVENVNLFLGAVCDFRLGYGKVLSRKSKIIIVNRNSSSLHQVKQTNTMTEK